MDAAGRVSDEKDRGDHQAVQAGRRQGSAHFHRRDRHDCVGGARLRPAEGPHRALPRRPIHGRFPPQDQGRGRRPGPPRRQGRGGDRRSGQARQHRRRQDLRQSGSDGGAHPDGRARRERALVPKEVAVKRFSLALAMVLVVSATAIVAWAQQPAGPPPSAAPAAATPAAPAASKIDKGDTAWMLASSALVLLMTAPGLALFYGGMVRQKNALATLMQSFIILAVISIQWILWGYTLAFGPDKGGIIGGLEWFGLRGVGVEPFDAYSKTIPHQVFMLFQMMFAVITPALITGAFAERKKFSAFLLFTVLWATFVYDPLAHWVWGDGGWLKKLGALDFAGGTVVHISSGMSALVCAVMLGRRRGYGHQPMQPHNLPMTVMGASLDVVGVHGVGGTWGALATGLFASKAINEGGDNGLFFGNPGQVWIQIVAILATYVLAIVVTAVILKVVDALVGLRVSEEDEVAGLDLSQHSETAYAAGGGYDEVGSGHPGAFGEALPRVAH